MTLKLRRTTGRSTIWLCGMPDLQWVTTRQELDQCSCVIEDEGSTYKVIKRNDQCIVHRPDGEQ